MWTHCAKKKDITYSFITGGVGGGLIIPETPNIHIYDPFYPRYYTNNKLQCPNYLGRRLLYLWKDMPNDFCKKQNP